ncbi:unnamed protein product [Enterobius vermicularis]|uniref:Signal peptide protein n=1 Tax=Enterobius vermicularis TaxID=51028 RepID=A0A0N4VD31_ENTVE|nr:unnamed protein product [Enterobius vermicularis]
MNLCLHNHIRIALLVAAVSTVISPVVADEDTDIPCEYAFLKKLTKPEKFFVVGRNSACNVFLFTSDRLGALDEFLLGYDIINEQECADDMKPILRPDNYLYQTRYSLKTKTVTYSYKYKIKNIRSLAYDVDRDLTYVLVKGKLYLLSEGENGAIFLEQVVANLGLDAEQISISQDYFISRGAYDGYAYEFTVSKVNSKSKYCLYYTRDKQTKMEIIVRVTGKTTLYNTIYDCLTKRSPLPTTPQRPPSTDFQPFTKAVQQASSKNSGRIVDGERINRTRHEKH